MYVLARPRMISVRTQSMRLIEGDLDAPTLLIAPACRPHPRRPYPQQSTNNSPSTSDAERYTAPGYVAIVLKLSKSQSLSFGARNSQPGSRALGDCGTSTGKRINNHCDEQHQGGHHVLRGRAQAEEAHAVVDRK